MSVFGLPAFLFSNSNQMKKIFFIVTVLSSSVRIFAQEPADALRYSWTNQGGTARQQAIGGAMGSLGGDISSTFINPPIKAIGTEVIANGKNIFQLKCLPR